jgi:hypothetical protein
MDAAVDPSLARRLWLVGEPVHALTYFAQPSFDAWAAAGVPGFWRGYFATRAAAFGAVGPELVTASFYNFAPAMVAQALPAVWELVSPADAIDARLAGTDASLRSVLGPRLGERAVDDPAVADTVEIVREAVAAADRSGRALFAANVALEWPDAPHLALWHGLTCLREHRGDGHNAALVAAGIDGCQAHVLAGAAGGAPRDVTQPTRGWTDDEWDAAVADLSERRVLADDGSITADGRALHAHVEAVTDELAAAPWVTVGAERTQRVHDALLPWATAIHDSRTIRQPNPMGLPPL